MHGQVDRTDGQQPANTAANTGRHRVRRPTPAAIALGLTVTALLTAFGMGAALLPGSFIGPGSPAKVPATVLGAPGEDAGAGAGSAQQDGPPLSASPGKGAPRATKPSAAKPSPSKSPTRTKPKPKPKPKPPRVSSGQVARENEVIRLTNVERAKAGCGKVRLNTRLRTAMRAHTDDMAAKDYFSHDSQDGGSPWDRAKSAGYRTPIGENIAQGQRNAADVMSSWMNSPGHKANILNCNAKAIGVAMTNDGGTRIWGQLFGSS